jgi:membrane protein
MIVVVWIFFSSCILFLGAEFTQVHAEMYGTRIEPSSDAIAVPEGMTPAAATEKKKQQPREDGARDSGAGEPRVMH